VHKAQIILKLVPARKTHVSVSAVNLLLLWIICTLISDYLEVGTCVKNTCLSLYAVNLLLMWIICAQSPDYLEVGTCV